MFLDGCLRFWHWNDAYVSFWRLDHVWWPIQEQENWREIMFARKAAKSSRHLYILQEVIHLALSSSCYFEDQTLHPSPTQEKCKAILLEKGDDDKEEFLGRFRCEVPLFKFLVQKRKDYPGLKEKGTLWLLQNSIDWQRSIFLDGKGMVRIPNVSRILLVEGLVKRETPRPKALWFHHDRSRHPHRCCSTIQQGCYNQGDYYSHGSGHQEEVPFFKQPRHHPGSPSRHSND